MDELNNAASSDADNDAVEDDALLALPPERLAQMLRDKRKAEATVRTKLRETETHRDTLAGTVTGFQRERLHELATLGGMVPTALQDLDGHVDVASVLGDDGLVDPEKVTEALAALKLARPHYFPQIPRTSGSDGHQGAISGRQSATWSDVISN